MVELPASVFDATGQQFDVVFIKLDKIKTLQAFKMRVSLINGHANIAQHLIKTYVLRLKGHMIGILGFPFVI